MVNRVKFSFIFNFWAVEVAINFESKVNQERLILLLDLAFISCNNTLIAVTMALQGSTIQFSAMSLTSANPVFTGTMGVIHWAIEKLVSVNFAPNLLVALSLRISNEPENSLKYGKNNRNRFRNNQ